MLVGVLAALLPMQQPANVPGKVDHDPKTWAPTTHVGDQDGVLGSWLGPGSALAVVAIWRVKLFGWMVSLSLSQSPSPCLSVSLCLSVSPLHLSNK